MIHELRIYHVMPGKMKALHDRFQHLTLELFARHGIDAIAFWTESVGPNSNTLSYLVRWEDGAEREVKWRAMAADPDWIAGAARSEIGGPLISHWENRLLSPTAYSALR